MALEDKSLAYSPDLSVQIRTIKAIDKRHPQIGYKIILVGMGGRGGLPVRKNEEEFISGLSEGDKIITVIQSNRVLTLYGPIDEGKLYISREE